MLVDSHCHLNLLNLTEFENNLDNVIQAAAVNGVQQMLCVCVELNDIPILRQIADKYSNLHISVGIHPDAEMVTNEPDAAGLVALANYPNCIAIGETGLDYYRSEPGPVHEHQQWRFRQHIQAARVSSKPLIIHTRQAAEDTLKLMIEEKAQEIGGVMHCFSENWDIAKRALDLNFYISFSGIVTFKNATLLQEVAKKVPLDRILIETDAPYLAPVPFRGKQNHPALVKHVAEMLSNLRGDDFETIATQTTANYYNCFRVTQP